MPRNVEPEIEEIMEENEKNIIDAAENVAESVGLDGAEATPAAEVGGTESAETDGKLRKSGGKAAKKADQTSDTAAGTTDEEGDDDGNGDEETADGKKKSFAQMLNDYVNSDEDIPLNFSVQAIFGGDSLLGIVRRNLMLILVIVVFSLVNTSLRYMMEEARMENDRYNKMLIDRQYKALSVESKVKEMTLSTHIEGLLRDTTIHIPTEQAYSLKVAE